MIRVLILVSLLALVAGIASADPICATGTVGCSVTNGTLVNVPGSISNPGPGTNCGGVTGSLGSAPSQCGYLATGPYWDNDSGKGNFGNIGYFLTASGLYAGDTTYCPIASCDYLSSSGAPTSITLDSTSGHDVVTLLGDPTLDHTDVFGIYNTSTMAETALAGPGSLLGDIGNPVSIAGDLSNGENYGFYLTRSCYTECPVGDPTPGSITLFSNVSLNACTTLEPSGTCNTSAAQHFAIFESTTAPNVYYIGIEDWGLLGGVNNGEGNGDFNDIVFELNTNIPPVPEPATFSLIGAGLFGIGLARLRTRKSRT